jgi:hypothetical protein
MRNRLTAMMFVLAMTSMVCVYSQGSADTLEYSEEHQKILQEIKTCIGIEDIRIVQSKTSEVMIAWAMGEAKNEKRSTTSRLNKETGIYVSMSLPSTMKYTGSKKEDKKYRKSQEYKEEQAANSALFAKVQACLAAECIRIIETKDKEILKKWVEIELEEKGSFSVFFDKETGIGTGVSMPKTENEK